MTKQPDGELPVAERVPEFGSEDAEREWWATHDTSHLPGRDVELRYTGTADERRRAVTVQIDEETVARLKRVAAEQGVDYRSMVRAWILERLRREATVT